MLCRLVCAATLVAPLPAHAAAPSTPAPSAADIVITASRLPLNARTTPYSVQLLPANRIAGRASIADALSDLADVYVQSPGGRSGSAALFLRGADPNFTAVLLDGVALNNPANALGGAVNVSEISAPLIGRAELVTGPLSSLYGSGSLAGVVNLVVRGGSERPELSAIACLGSAGEGLALLRWRGPLAGRYGGSLSAVYDDGGKDPGGARFKTKALVGKIAPQGRTDAGRIVFRIATTDVRAFPDSSGGPEFAAIRTLERRHGREEVVGASQPVVESGPVRVDVSGSYLQRRDRTISPGVAGTRSNPVGVPSGEDDTRYRRGLGQVAVRYSAGPWQGVAGVEAQREAARSTGFLSFFGRRVPSGFGQNRWTRSAFAEASRTSGALLVNVGGRIDRIDRLRTQLTGRAGLRLAVPGTPLALRAAAGTGFKAPSFYALGNPFVGNPALRPERSRSIEAGLDYQVAGGPVLSLTVFRTRFIDLIDFVPDPFPQLQNRSSVISKGVSASASTSLGPRVGASFQLQYVTTVDRDTGDQLLNRPRWRSSALLEWRPADAITFTVRHRYVGARTSYSVPTGVARLGSYHTVSAEAALATRSGSRLRLIVDNALDGEFADAVGFRSPGRRARLQLEQRF